ncbi:SBBP repeat-containing protein [Sorangium sp. So ce260]|uniref:SBBP repeat-containing protein n=1 Tax=Sorangium sp. So ce260 TaxID=3133291 RepID=UPI003F6082FD
MVTRTTLRARSMLVGSALVLTLPGACSDPEPFDPRPDAGSGSGGGTGGGPLCSVGEEQPCYPGPADTEGVGVCAAGVRRCLPDGQSFGECEGAVVPKLEDCSTTVDDDCDGETNEPDAMCVCTPGQIEACYGGPDGTNGVGLCAAGLRMCDISGTSWRPCDGQITPALETCADDTDEDCDGVACSAPLWSALFGDPNIQSATGVGVDAQGNIYIGGTFSGTINLGGDTLVSIGTADVYVASFDATGAHRWSARFGGSGAETLNGLALTPDGKLVIGGTFYGSFTFGGATLSSVNALDSFLATLGGDGTPGWARQIGDSADQTLRSIAVDKAGNIVIAGYFSGALLCSAPPVPVCANSEGGTDIFVRKYDPLGAVLWTRIYGDTSNQFATSVAVDGESNVFITGRYNGTLAVGPRQVRNTGLGPNLFVLKLDSSGNSVWLSDYGDTASQAGTGIAVAPSGAVLVTGTYVGELDFGPEQSLRANDAPTAFVVSLAPDGAPAWARSFAGDGAQEGTAIIADAAGNVVVAGAAQGVIALGDEPLTNGGGFDAFVAKLDPQGKTLWGKVLGAAGNQKSNAAAISPETGAVVLCGTAEGRIDFGLGEHEANGTDAFAVVLSP